jgi:hypothetical protein
VQNSKAKETREMSEELSRQEDDCATSVAKGVDMSASCKPQLQWVHFVSAIPITMGYGFGRWAGTIFGPLAATKTRAAMFTEAGRVILHTRS